ncbi:hypothetical protein MMC17_004917 [Xylographa soralifera]|nr:hypothetical protein [Xylographa soralifera]
MDTYWKDEGGEDESFWEHEWGKHGTCYSTLEPSCYVNYTPQEEVVDFFQRTVDLFMELNTYKFLADAGIVPSATKNYTSIEVLAALNKPRGVNATIECSDGQLDEVYYFYDVAGTIAEGKFVPQNPVGELSDCPASLQYLPKNISSTPIANDTVPTPPFVGKGYVLVEAKHAGRDVGCLNGAGAFVSSVTNTSCAVFTGKVSGNAVTLASTKGSCSVHNSELKCASSITTPTLFNDVTGNLAYNNQTTKLRSPSPHATMAAMGDNYYLPSLERCLDSDFQLLSWEAVYKGLLRLPSGSGEQALKHFFEDKRTIDLLTKVLSPFLAPTAETRAYFDTQTSAIHITPKLNGRYDISEIKEDSLWLSKEVGIEEIAALRIAVLEYQARPAAWLLQGFADKDAPGMDISAGSKSANPFWRNSSFNAGAGAARPPGDAFNSVQTRRLRLVELYLSERQYLLICADFIIFRSLHPGPFKGKDVDSWGIPLSPNRSSWLQDAGVQITNKWKLNHVASTSRNYWVIDAIAALELRIQNIGNASGWLQEEDTDIEVEHGWCQVQLTDISHILYIILNLTMSDPSLTRSDVFQTWYKFMGDYGFFEQFELPYPHLHTLYSFPIQCLVSLVSLAMLKLPLALVTIQDISTSTSAADSAENTPYLLNKDVITFANEVLMTAAGDLSHSASLAIFGWGILMQTIRGHAEESKESREVRQSQRAVDSFDALQHSNNDSNEGPSGQRRPSPHRRSSTGSDTSQQITYLENVLDIIKQPIIDEDPITFLARVSVDQLHVFDMITRLSVNFCTLFGSENFGAPGLKMRLLLLELIRASLEWLDYQPDIVQATLATLQGSDNYWNSLACTPTFDDGAPTTVFQEDQFLMQRIFEVARSRYPYESLPFLKICRTLASCRSSLDVFVGSEPLQQRLSKMETFTCLLPEESVSYRLHGDADSIYLELTSQLSMFDGIQPTKRPKYMFPIRNLQTSTNSTSSDSFELGEGTTGRTLTERRPHVVLWRHDYSALRYMGRILQHAVQDDALRDLQDAESTREIVTEIVGLITALLASVSYGQIHDWRQNYAGEMAGSLLDETSDGLGSHDDIVSLIFSIFESELHRSRSASNGTESNQLLLHCIQFTHALLALLPGRVWPFLSRSGLLGLDGSESRLAAVVATTEITSAKYEFLIGSIRLYEALVEDALAHIVSRKENQSAPTRYSSKEQDSLGTGITEVTMKKIIHGFERLMIDVLDSCRNWRFEFPEQRMEINTRICLLFDKTLSWCFSIDDNLDISHKLTSCLAPAADYLLDVFFPKEANDLPVQPLLNMLLEALSNSNNIMITNRFYREQAMQTEAAVRFITTLIRVNQYLDIPSSGLEGQIFKATPVLAKLYAADTGIRLPVIELLEALVKHAGGSSGQNHSLLGYMGQDTAKRFLDLLSVLDQPLNNANLSMYVWRLLSVIVGHRQQWLAIYLLTGFTPRDNLQDPKRTSKSSMHHVRPMLRIAVERFSDFDSIVPEEAISILDFLTQAADFWPWVVDEILKDSNLIKVFTDFLNSLHPLLDSGDQKGHEAYPNKLQMASQIVSICAMGVHHSSETGDTTFANKLQANLTYLVDCGVAVPTYNVSLHSNLRRNFESKFTSCTLMNLKRTTLSRSSLGKDFYYDMQRAEKVLAYDSAWAGRGGDGFREEFKRANINLSIVEAQVNLLHSWKTLVTQLSITLNADQKFNKTLAEIIRDCLRSNLDNNLPQAIFERLCQSRADLAFALMQRIVETTPRSAEARSILKPAWTTLRSINPDLGLELTVGDATYSRTLLKILYLALQAHMPSSETASSRASKSMENPSTMENTQVVLEILSVVVAKGFRSLTTLLHEDVTKVSPSDYALINAILRAGLGIPGIERYPEQLVAQFTDNHTARYACTLLSWSHQLTIGDDPVYGELSMVFLLELSAVPVLAEAMAVEGVLTGISTATLMQYFRRPGGIGPFSEPTTMYGIWFRNLLPLALNLLGAIGAPIAAEVSAFIDQFRGQLSRSSNSFDTKPPSPSDPVAGYITLGMASEVHSLALIRDILETFREAGPSAGIVAANVAELSWDRLQVKEDIENWLQRRKTLRECILATNEKEEVWSRQMPLSATGGAENRLEEKVVAEMSAALSILGDTES